MADGQSQTVLRALRILDCFSLECPELGVREVARQLDLSSSTAGRLLATLRSAGVLAQNPGMRTYSLGPRLLTWAGLYTGALNVRVTAWPILDRLRRATRETTTLYVLDGDERVCVERLVGQENISAILRLGERLPCYAGAGGKVLLAYLAPAARQALLGRLILKRFTPRTIRHRARLERELAVIRRQGYAASVAERFAGASAIAAPVLGADATVIAAVTVSGPSNRFTGARRARDIRHVTRAARDLSCAMGDQPARHPPMARAARDRA